MDARVLTAGPRRREVVREGLANRRAEALDHPEVQGHLRHLVEQLTGRQAPEGVVAAAVTGPRYERSLSGG